MEPIFYQPVLNPPTSSCLPEVIASFDEKSVETINYLEAADQHPSVISYR